MEFRRYTQFEDFALKPVSILLRNAFDNSYIGYNSELIDVHRNTLQERRNEKIKYAYDRDNLNIYINDFYSKVRSLKTSLFHEADGKVTYLLDNLLIDESETDTMRCIRILKDLLFQLFDDAKKDYDLIPIAIPPPPVPKSKRRGPRNPDVGSFVLKNPDVNFNAIHARLIPEGHHFIDPAVTSVDDIRAVFSGHNITEKVVWYNSNSLRYFIRELRQRHLIVHPNEGIWRRTIACFRSEEGEFKQKDFKDTKDPTSSVTLLLDEVIRLFSV
jgi:hypothetical protein